MHVPQVLFVPLRWKGTASSIVVCKTLTMIECVPAVPKLLNAHQLVQVLPPVQTSPITSLTF